MKVTSVNNSFDRVLAVNRVNNAVEGVGTARLAANTAQLLAETSKDSDAYSITASLLNRRENGKKNTTGDSKKSGIFRILHLMQLFHEELGMFVGLLESSRVSEVRSNSTVPQETEVIIRQQWGRLAKMHEELSLELDQDIRAISAQPMNDLFWQSVTQVWDKMNNMFNILKTFKYGEAFLQIVAIKEELIKLEQEFDLLVQGDFHKPVSTEKIETLKKMLSDSPISMMGIQENVPLSISFNLLS